MNNLRVDCFCFNITVHDFDLIEKKITDRIVKRHENLWVYPDTINNIEIITHDKQIERIDNNLQKPYTYHVSAIIHYMYHEFSNGDNVDDFITAYRLYEEYNKINAFTIVEYMYCNNATIHNSLQKLCSKNGTTVNIEKEKFAKLLIDPNQTIFFDFGKDAVNIAYKFLRDNIIGMI